MDLVPPALVDHPNGGRTRPSSRPHLRSANAAGPSKKRTMITLPCGVREATATWALTLSAWLHGPRSTAAAYGPLVA